MKTGNLTEVGVRVIVRKRFLASNFSLLSSRWNLQKEFLRNLCIFPFLCVTNPNPNPSKKKTKFHWIWCSTVLQFSMEFPDWISENSCFLGNSLLELLSRSVIRTVNICLNYIHFLILFFDLGCCLLLLSSHLMRFLWSVIFHLLSNCVSVLFRIVKKILIVHISVVPMECLSPDSKQKRVVLSLNWRISHLVTAKRVFINTLLCNILRIQIKSKFLVQRCSTHSQMLHDTGKSIAVSFGFVPEKLQVGKKQCSKKVGLTFFFFFFKWSWWFVHVLCVLSIGVGDVIK